MRIITLNLNGIRSASRKNFFAWLKKQSADAVCVQELKAQALDMTDEMLRPHGYQGYFHYASKKGYSGVGMYTPHKPDKIIHGLGRTDMDREGRYLRLDFGRLSIVSVYIPSGSSSEERQQIKFNFMGHFYLHLKRLKKSDQEIILCGDWNIAHTEKDLKNWKFNQKNSGFLPEERAWLSKVFDKLGWVDVFRVVNQEVDQYTWWSNRGQAWAKNVGWRIDYQIATPTLANLARKTLIYKAERFSDHAPLTIDYDYDLQT